MDPQSQPFVSYSGNSDAWKLQGDLARLHQTAAEHAERLARLEKKQDDDTRLKSVWGHQSPFPSVLSGTPQQTPLHHPPADTFRGFDGDSGNLISSLHLDPEDEPRRGMGATSRANSVRFDESANQNHFSHSSRNSMEFISRPGSGGLGSLRLDDRTASHKSEGRASSVHSARSIASGRASSLNLDTGYNTGDSGRSPLDTPSIAPGLLLLGSVPAIIRCWMNTNFKHDALLYAAVCSASYRSHLDIRLIEKLGFEASITTDDQGMQIVELPVYLPEAVPHPASSRSSSPAPQLPCLQVQFCVIQPTSDPDHEAIQIILGSDVLRAHSADILFSSNCLELFDEDQCKVTIPLVRPEKEAAFQPLRITTETLRPTSTHAKNTDVVAERPSYTNGFAQESSGAASLSSRAASPHIDKFASTTTAADLRSATPVHADLATADSDALPTSRLPTTSRTILGTLGNRIDNQESTDSGAQAATIRGPPASWTNNWRKDNTAPSNTAPSTGTPQSAGLDWANASKGRLEPTYQRRDTGIKVLKPKLSSRTISGSVAGSPAVASSPGEGKSRFFDEGRRRSGTLETPSTGLKTAEPKKDTAAASSPANKTKSNPIGGGSAFSWLNPGGGSK